MTDRFIDWTDWTIAGKERKEKSITEIKKMKLYGLIFFFYLNCTTGFLQTWNNFCVFWDSGVMEYITISYSTWVVVYL